MLRGSRVATSVDIQRVAEALSVPGIDPRTWVSLAIVRKVTVDPAEGVFVNVILMPSRQPETARVGQEYCGVNFGLHTPLEVDDEVLVTAPSGNPDEGLVVTRRLWGGSDPPPQQVVDHPSDVVLVVKPGQNVRQLVSGGGKVVLAEDDAEQESVRGTKFLEELDKVLTQLKAVGTALAGGVGPYPAGATLATTITAFQALAAQYKTGKVVLP